MAVDPGTLFSPSTPNSDAFTIKHGDGTTEVVRIKLDATGKLVIEPYSKTN